MAANSIEQMSFEDLFGGRESWRMFVEDAHASLVERGYGEGREFVDNGVSNMWVRVAERIMVVAVGRSKEDVRRAKFALNWIRGLLHQYKKYPLIDCKIVQFCERAFS